MAKKLDDWIVTYQWADGTWFHTLHCCSRARIETYLLESEEEGLVMYASRGGDKPLAEAVMKALAKEPTQ